MAASLGVSLQFIVQLKTPTSGWTFNWFTLFVFVRCAVLFPASFSEFGCNFSKLRRKCCKDEAALYKK